METFTLRAHLEMMFHVGDEIKHVVVVLWTCHTSSDTVVFAYSSEKELPRAEQRNGAPSLGR